MTSLKRSCDVIDPITKVPVTLNNFDSTTKDLSIVKYLIVSFFIFSLALSIMLNARVHSVAIIGSVLRTIACLGWSKVTALHITQVTAIEEL